MRTKKDTKAVETTAKTEEKKLVECFSLWKHESKNGFYLTGKAVGDSTKLVGFMQYDKTNEKAPDLIVYMQTEKGAKLTKDDKVASLWLQTSKSKKDYFSGLTNENEKLVGFISDEKNEKAPYITVYYKELEEVGLPF